MKDDLERQAWAHQVAFPGQGVDPKGSCPVYGDASIRAWSQQGSRRYEIRLSSPGAEHGRLLCYGSRYGWAGAEWTDGVNDIYAVAYGKTRYALYRWFRIRSGA
jgi:hypothetical protein